MFILCKKYKLSLTHIQLYKKVKPRIINKELILKLDEIIGPKTGNPNPYSGIHIPINSRIQFIKMINIRLLSAYNPHPIPNPSKPVVNGKINNSLGSIKINKSIVKQ